jgi:LysM repeat protein
MKKALMFGTAVFLINCVVIVSLFLVQGCKSTRATKGEGAAPVMPPLSAPSVTTPVVESALPSAKIEETIEYIVKSSDSLGSIAKKHNVTRAELVELNKIADPNKIRIGQKLIIPKRARLSAPAAAKSKEVKKTRKSEKAEQAAEPTPSLAKGINEYVVQAGDTMSKIASRFNMSMIELREANKLVNDKLKVGQKLIIPEKKKAEGAPAAAPAVGQEPSAPAAAPEASAAPANAPAAPAAAATPKASGITHIVLPTEDLNAIAKLYAVSADDIANANQLGANRTVKPGQKLVIPQP